MSELIPVEAKVKVEAALEFAASITEIVVNNNSEAEAAIT